MSYITALYISGGSRNESRHFIPDVRVVCDVQRYIYISKWSAIRNLFEF